METGKLIDLPFGPLRQTTWIESMSNRVEDKIREREKDSNRLKCFAHIAKGMCKCKKTASAMMMEHLVVRVGKFKAKNLVTKARHSLHRELYVKVK